MTSPPSQEAVEARKQLCLWLADRFGLHFELKPESTDFIDYAFQSAIDKSSSAELREMWLLWKRVNELEREEVRRIKHLNRLGTWAQQDPTGPLRTSEAWNVKDWVLNELKAALGSEWKQQEWEPSYLKLRDERDKLLKQIQSRAAQPQEWSGSIGGLITDPDGNPIGVALTTDDAKAIVAAHNASLR
jgi:hypothetical protein